MPALTRGRDTLQDMTVETIINQLVTQAPNLVAIIIVVVIFMRSQDKRDESWQSVLKDLTAQIDKMSRLLVVVKDLTYQVDKISQMLSEHDTAMKLAAKMLENAVKAKRKT